MRVSPYVSQASMISAIIKEVSSTTEQALTGQLNDLVKRGLLVAEMSDPVVVQLAGTDEIEVRRSVRLHLKSEEYINQLETENAALKSNLRGIAEALAKLKKELGE